MAEKLNISYAAATKRVASCRKVGILGPVERGKASLGRPMGHGGAATLRSLNTAKEIMAERTATLEDAQSAPQGDEAPGRGGQ